jgi:MFS family permease
MGQHMETMAVAWLMKELTESPYYLGLLAVCKVAPLFFFALIGGVVADRVDRRKLLLVCFLCSAFVSIALLVLAQRGMIAPWHLLLAGVLTSANLGINHPARDSLIPNLIPKDQWMNSIALDTISVRMAAIISAVIAGNFISLFGTTPLFGFRAAGMLLASQWLLMMDISSIPARRKKHGAWDNLRKGLKYAMTHSLIMALVLVFALREFQTELSTVFLPFFADNILHSGATGFGYLNMAQGVGALAGLFGVATLGNFKYKGKLITVVGILMGLLLVCFSLSHILILSTLLLICANGFGITCENVARTALQTIVPDEMRGRVMSLREVVRGLFGTWVSYGLGLGGEYLGVVTASMLLGIFIIACVSFIALFLPSFRKM